MIELGNAVVLDASNLSTGDKVVIEGEIFEITKHNAAEVVLRPIVGFELLLYRMNKHKIILLVLALVIAVGVVIIK